MQWSSEADPAVCYDVIGSFCGTPDFGTYEATADIAETDPMGIWLYPYINTDSGDCEDTTAVHTFQDLTYQMGPPATTFW